MPLQPWLDIEVVGFVKEAKDSTVRLFDRFE